MNPFLPLSPCVCVAGIALAQAAAAEVYVSPGGSDSNPGTLVAPLATLAAAGKAVRTSSHKTVYLRAGTYPGASLALTAADSGETWSFYPPDGYDSAVLDGGSSGATTGGNILTIDGASHVTINGLTIRNFQQFAIGIHGGPAEPGMFFPNTTASADANTIENCIIQTGYNTARQNVFPMNGIFQIGTATNTTIANNAIRDLWGGAILIADKDGAANQGQTFDGLVIKNNAILNTDVTHGDSGAIYLVNRFQNVSRATITHNFIRDYQGTASNGIKPARDVGIYLDEGTQGVTLTGNIVANTANAINSSHLDEATSCVFTNAGNNLVFTGNICDLGTSPQIANFVISTYSRAYKPMTGNVIAGNIFIGNWPGAQRTYSVGVGPDAYPEGGGYGNPEPAAIKNNLYYNHGSGSLSTTGTVFGDAAPVTGIDPQMSGASYTLAPTSPAYNPPVSFPHIAGGWGPPGYVMPAGTAPSYLIAVQH